MNASFKCLRRNRKYLMVASLIVFLLVIIAQLTATDTEEQRNVYVNRHMLKKQISQNNEVFVNGLGELVIPNDNLLHTIDAEDLQEIYHRYVESIQIRCRSQIHLGNEYDGGYHVCEDSEVIPVKPCLVYSFGTRGDFNFDDAVSNRFGCEVHSFDPGDGAEDHQHSKDVWFHNIGISDQNGVLENGWNLRTLGTIRHALGDDKRSLDILKIDVEGAEWPSLAEMVQSGSIRDVKQLIVEFHVHTYFNDLTSRTDYISHLTLLRSLYQLGFRIFYFRMWNPLQSLVFQGGGVYRTGCHEVHFMRVSE